MSRLARLEAVLKEQFAPSHITISDQSGNHEGHAGARPEGETHYSVKLISGRFSGLNKIARHRLVYDVLGDEFTSGLHALQLVLKAPEEP